jgi:hypothetical protein
MCTARGRSSLIPSRVSPRWRATARGPAGELLSARGSLWMVLAPLRESHSARGSQRIYAPKGPPEAITPGEPLQAHRGGMSLTQRPLSRGWDTFLGPRGGWASRRACSEPRSDPLGHASTAWVGPPSPCFQCSERTQGSDCRWRALPNTLDYHHTRAPSGAPQASRV